MSPSRGDVLADLGSGKGAVLLLAGLAGFPRAIGIEIDPQLCGQARRNIQRARFRPQAQAQVVTASAADWPVPDEVTTVFTFNSFTGQVFRSAMGQVFASYDRRAPGVANRLLPPVGTRLAHLDRPGHRRGGDIPRATRPARMVADR